jgi:hypothetical protein
MASPASGSAAAAQIVCSSPTTIRAIVDFDGDGTADSAVLAPGADGGRGAIEVRPNRGASGATTLEPGDGLIPSVPVRTGGSGLTFTVLSINGDACSDLAIGLPHYTVDGKPDAGAVQILYGSKSGFVAGPLVTPDSSGVPGAAQAGENFGAALHGDAENLFVGVPGWSSSVGGARLAHVGEAMWLSLFNYSQDPTPMNVRSNYAPMRLSHPQAGDRLGTTVGSKVAGAPYAARHGLAKVGFTQATRGVPGVPARGNHFGYSLSAVGGQVSPIAVGIPGMSLPGARHAGAVAVLDGRSLSSRWQLIDANAPGVTGTAHAGDAYGSAVFVSPRGYPGGAGDFLLLGGTPNLAVGGKAEAGRVQVFTTTGTTVTLAGSQLLSAAAGPRRAAHYGSLVR